MNHHTRLAEDCSSFYHPEEPCCITASGECDVVEKRRTTRSFRLKEHLGTFKVMLEVEDVELGLEACPGFRVCEVTGLPAGSTWWDAAGIWRKACPPEGVFSIEAPEGYVAEKYEHEN